MTSDYFQHPYVRVSWDHSDSSRFLFPAALCTIYERHPANQYSLFSAIMIYLKFIITILFISNSDCVPVLTRLLYVNLIHQSTLNWITLSCIILVAQPETSHYYPFRAHVNIIAICECQICMAWYIFMIYKSNTLIHISLRNATGKMSLMVPMRLSLPQNLHI